MDKIVFEDGTKISDGKITIDEQDYVVVPAQYSGRTPLSAYVLNKLQDNIERAINAVEITELDASKLTGTASIDTTGNAGTATKLKQTKRINIAGAVSGNADFDGSENITIDVSQSNIAVLSGNMTVGANLYGLTQISYPEGFTSSNCVVISLGIQLSTSTNKEWYYEDLQNYQYRESSIVLYPSDIRLGITNKVSSSRTYNYKIVLLKTS